MLKIRDLEPTDTVARELALFKLAADGAQRAEVMQICEIFRGKVVDVTRRSMIVEITGTTDKIEAFEKHGPPVRPDRDDAHRRDRDLARARRDLSREAQAESGRQRAEVFAEVAVDRGTTQERYPQEDVVTGVCQRPAVVDRGQPSE